MDERQAIASLGDAHEQLEDEAEHEPSLGDVRQTQTLAGGLNWLATRTRPDISFVVAQLSPAATRAPQRAVALGKKVLICLTGARDHGIRMAAGGARHPRVEWGPVILEAFGDASYETGYAQRGLLTTFSSARHLAAGSSEWCATCGGSSPIRRANSSSATAAPEPMKVE